MRTYRWLVLLFGASMVFAHFVPAAVKPGASEQEFCRLDKDGNREVTFEEFDACEFHKLEHVKQLPFADPELFDKKKDQQMTEAQLKRYLFNKADKNRNKKIDRTEWEEFYQSLMDK